MWRHASSLSFVAKTWQSRSAVTLRAGSLFGTEFRDCHHLIDLCVLAGALVIG
jgi:hypothetical protein